MNQAAIISYMRKEMHFDGVGALHLAYEELKKKLASEGLFDARYKKANP
ncbi:hypothetical protein ACEQPO_18715 [Bacillus sp. SL00103]